MDNLILVVIDILVALAMFLLGLSFYKSKGKAADFLSGYNTKSKEERLKYDENEMCREYGRFMMLMAIPFIPGAIIDYFVLLLGSAIAWGVWIIMLIILIVKRVKKESGIK